MCMPQALNRPVKNMLKKKREKATAMIPVNNITFKSCQILNFCHEQCYASFYRLIEIHHLKNSLKTAVLTLYCHEVENDT